jgi:hypothetical protein
LPNAALEILLEIYNNILRARVFPDDWKKYILKNDKTNLRPIYILGIMRVHGTRTNDKHAHILVEKNQKFSETQNGFW